MDTRTAAQRAYAARRSAQCWDALATGLVALVQDEHGRFNGDHTTMAALKYADGQWNAARERQHQAEREMAA